MCQKFSNYYKINLYQEYPIAKSGLKRYVGFKEEFRKVTSECLVSYKGNKYSVPHYFASKEVWLRVLYGTTLQIYSSKNKLIATHTISLKKGEVIVNKEHFSGYRNENSFDSIAVSISRVLKRFSSYINIHKFIENIKIQKRINPAYHLYKIVNLFEYYNDADGPRSCGIPLRYMYYGYGRSNIFKCL